MVLSQKNNFIDKFLTGLRPVDTRPLHEWLHSNVSLPGVYNPQGQFNVDFYPYLKAPMSDLTDDKVKQLNLASCVQAGKSMVQQLFLPYILLENPAYTSMVFDTQDNAKKCIEERIIPLLKNNKDTKKLLNSQRFNVRKTGISLPHMTLRVGGPAESNLNGYTAKYIMGDEVWRWQADYHKDVFEKLRNRQLAYNATKKSIFSSQPDYEGSDWHKECMRGLWYKWGYRCPDCKVLQLYEWNGQRDETDYGMVFDATDKNNDYNKKAGSGRLVCQHCFYEIKDTPSNRKSLLMNGDYILVHSGPDHSIHTYSWGQFVNISIPFKQIALNYFDAVLQQRNEGLRTKHELFRQQTLGEFWKVGQQTNLPKLMIQAYQPSDEWKDETIRFLTIDVQQSGLYWLVRAWSNHAAESRLIDWGMVVGFAEIEEIITKYKIHPLCVGVDSGYDTKNVYAESVQRSKVITLNNGKKMIAQWTCFKGDGGQGLSPKKFYKHKIEENGRVIELDRLYSTCTKVDPMFPVGSKFKCLRANLYAWSNYSIKWILCNLRDNKLPFAWKLNERANADYTKQMFSEELNWKTGRFEMVGTENHIFDCECLQLIMALQSDCYHPAAEDLNKIASSPELVPV